MLTIFKLLVFLVFWCVICLYLLFPFSPCSRLYLAFDEFAFIRVDTKSLFVESGRTGTNKQGCVWIWWVRFFEMSLTESLEQLDLEEMFSGWGKASHIFWVVDFFSLFWSPARVSALGSCLGESGVERLRIVLFWPHAFSKAINSGKWLHCFMTFSLSCGVTDAGWNTYWNKREWWRTTGSDS